MKYEIEEETGGYVRNGDVLEWHWKEPKADASSAPGKADEKTEAAPKKRGRPKKEAS